MPELAEVAYYARQWDAGLGKRIARVHAHATSRVFRGGHAGDIAKALKGTTYRQSETHGKNMLFAFSGGHWLGGHLGMTGELLTAAPHHEPLKHDHLVLFTKDAALIYRDYRMFGRWRLDQSKTEPEWWHELPPEILSKSFTAALVGDILTRRARTPLKVLLLDQSLFPGIGNWMADEVLWQLRLHPSTPSGDAAPAALRKTLQSITRTSLRTIARDWSDPPKSWLFSHRWKAGGHCPRCGTALHRADFRGRTACWCPKCQGKGA
ncbi:MAG TPA: DNA-formamidopyrimidine glycosylase family protein [Verrucomicrobiales bacterium]|nr:DNA-formamidopyrimidine glycosylase family protein [Verrucomicrobiales bacterium]